MFGESSLTGSGTLVANAVESDDFNMYVKDAGVWKDSIPYVKYEGTWIEPQSIYKNVSGTWQRVYLR